MARAVAVAAELLGSRVLVTSVFIGMLECYPARLLGMNQSVGWHQSPVRPRPRFKYRITSPAGSKPLAIALHRVWNVARIDLPACGRKERDDKRDDFGIVGKTALVTGSGRNIGRAIVLELVAHGANVIVNTRTNEACRASSQRATSGASTSSE